MCRAAKYILPALLGAIACRLPAATVTSCDEASLRAAIEGGGLVQFACDGVIILSQTIWLSADTILDGTGHSVTLNGSNALRIFAVSGVSLTLSNLTLADGRAPATSGGGALTASSSTIVIAGCTFTNNHADRWGGAIFTEDGTVLEIAACTFVDNRAEYGGCIAIGGPTSISQSTFWRNSANTQGGALWIFGSRLDMVNSTFVANQAYSAGGIRHSSSEPAVVRHCTFIQNLPSNNAANPIVARHQLHRAEHRRTLLLRFEP